VRKSDFSWLTMYLLIIELRFDAMLCTNLGCKISDAGNIKCSHGPQVPQRWCKVYINWRLVWSANKAQHTKISKKSPTDPINTRLEALPSLNLERKKSSYVDVYASVDRELWQQTATLAVNSNSICFTRPEMIMAFANLVNAVMSPVALIAFEMRLCLADDACNFKVFFY